MSPRSFPVDLKAQLVPGSFAHAMHHLVVTLDLSECDAHYSNHEVGASAQDPTMPLKAATVIKTPTPVLQSFKRRPLS